MFGASLPSFNVQGELKVKTTIGALVSFSIMSLTFLFALLKFQHMSEFRNPSITTFEEEIEASKENNFSLTSGGFMIAFGMNSYIDGQVKNDERYVKWIARYEVVDLDGNVTWRYFPVRKCNNEDYERLYQPSESSANKIKKFKSEALLYCVDL